MTHLLLVFLEFLLLALAVLINLLLRLGSRVFDSFRSVCGVEAGDNLLDAAYSWVQREGLSGSQHVRVLTHDDVHSRAGLSCHQLLSRDGLGFGMEWGSVRRTLLDNLLCFLLGLAGRALVGVRRASCKIRPVPLKRPRAAHLQQLLNPRGVLRCLFRMSAPQCKRCSRQARKINIPY
ncbi:hypothetical protein MRB53_042398 [Persea americana]|nr:hypothetical protein MRB53_042398 [Persea americana]